MQDKNIIQDRMLSNIDDKYDKSKGQFFFDATKPVAIELEAENIKCDAAISKFDITNEKGKDLEQRVYQITGLNRKEATYASGFVLLTGVPGTRIEKGLLVASAEFDYKVQDENTIGENGVASVFVICTSPGRVGNIGQGYINQFPLTIQGLSSVTNKENIDNGYEAESDEELLERYFNKLQKPAKAGNAFHYEEWALSVQGVGGVRVHPRSPSLLYVTVVIADNNGLPANDELKTRVTEYIESQKPFGSNLIVKQANNILLNIKVKLILKDGYKLESVKDELAQNLTKRLRQIAFKQDYLSYARIGGIIIDTNGVSDYKDLLINNGTSNVELGEDDIATLGVLEIE